MAIWTVSHIANPLEQTRSPSTHSSPPRNGWIALLCKGGSGCTLSSIPCSPTPPSYFPIDGYSFCSSLSKHKPADFFCGSLSALYRMHPGPIASPL